MFTLEKSPLGIWFSTNTRHHLLIGKGATPKRFPKASQINIPSELFDTVDIDVSDCNFRSTYVYKELSQRSNDVQGMLSRLRPYLPIPYLPELGLEPPILAIRFFEAVNPEKPTALAMVSQQVFKVPDFMSTELNQCLERNNTGPVSITLQQMDAWGLDLIKLQQLKRCRPLIICTNGLPSLWNQRVTPLQPHDMMSMRAQVSLLKWVARRTYEAYRYHEPANLIGLYKDLWIGEANEYRRAQITDKPLYVDPFELGADTRKLLK